LLDQIQQTTWCGYNYVHALPQGLQLRSLRDASKDCGGTQFEEPSVLA
jgi:hypothetical protein